MIKLASRISSAIGKAASARTALESESAESQSENAESNPESPAAQAESPESGDGSAASDPSRKTSATAEAAATAAEAAAEAEEAIREAKRLQAPTPEQLAAAREAYKAALAMRKMALERAETAGLDSATMKAKKSAGEGRRNRDPNRPKKPAPTMKEGGGGERRDDPAEEEYEDGLSLEMPEWLRKLGFPRSEWLKYKGSLESGLPDGALDKVAPEYRDLVRRYFEVLSKEK